MEDRPRLRELELIPAEAEGRPCLCLRDPGRLTDRVAVVPLAAAAVLALFDGHHTVAGIQADLARRGSLVAPDDIRRLAEALDDALLLDSPRFRAHRDAVRRAYLDAPVRAPALAGETYAARPDELAAAVGALLAAVQPAPARLAGLVAPHLDYPRGGPVYAAAYAALRPPSATRFVVLGTDHGDGPPLSLTTKAFGTPLGVLPADAGAVRRVAEAGGLDLEAGALCHRAEHSVELQAVLLRHLAGERAVSLVPVLCGPARAGAEPGADPAIARAIDALAELAADPATCVIAAGDLAHVGPRFGDARPVSAAGRARLEAADRRTLRLLAAGDAAALWRALVADGNRRRWCGLTPFYFLLRSIGGSAGTLQAYAQVNADENGGSVVSAAAMFFPR